MSAEATRECEQQAMIVRPKHMNWQAYQDLCEEEQVAHTPIDLEEELRRCSELVENNKKRR